MDIVLIAKHMPVGAAALRAALQAPFAAQDYAAPPSGLPAPPTAWASKYQRLAQDAGLDDTVLSAAFEHARRFLDPLLNGLAIGTWSPTDGAWL